MLTRFLLGSWDEGSEEAEEEKGRVCHKAQLQYKAGLLLR